MSSDNVSGSDSGAEAARVTASEYEEQRLKRIKENKARMEAMGLRSMASVLIGFDEKKSVRKLKGKAKLDEEYRPSDHDGSEMEDDDDDDDFFSDDRRKTAKKKNTLKKTKKVSAQNLMDTTYVMDEDEDLKLAMALSLREAENMEMTRNAGSIGAGTKEATASGKRVDARIQKDIGNRKRKKKQMGSRVQMTMDEVILHFFEFDAGKGGINLRDLRRMVYAHDFTWTDEEMFDMIKFFDSDGDGKLSLDDFRDIADRCKMIRWPENETST